MSNNKIVVGLDIGTTKICAIVGIKNQFGKLEILGMGKASSEGVSRGVVINIDKTTDAIRKAIDEASVAAGINIGVVNVGIAGQHIKSSKHHGSITRQSIDDEITVDDIKRLTQDMYKIVIAPGDAIIHVLPQDYIVDYEDGIKDPVGMSGIKLEADFHVITAQTTAIKNIEKCVRRAGLEVDELFLEPLASSLAVLSDEEMEAGVVLVDIGGGTTDVAIFYDGIIRHTAVIPFGGNIITNDIKEGLQVMSVQAELLKVKFGRSIADLASKTEVVSIPGLRNREPKEISVKNLAHIIEARMEEIVELVMAEIISSGYERKLAAGIVITGGGAQLQNLKQMYELMTGMHTRIGYPNEHLGKSKIDAVKSPMYATSVGLVLAGFMALDERENQYAERAQQMNSTTTNQQASNPTTPKTVDKEDKKPVLPGSKMFRGVQDRIRGFLMDDFDDKDSY